MMPQAVACDFLQLAWALVMRCMRAGKTTVAKLYGQVLKDLGLLSKGEVVVRTPADFIGSVLGESDKKTMAILEATVGCVLVIDEAYGLHPKQKGSVGKSGSSDPYKVSRCRTGVHARFHSSAAGIHD
jgi:hypothetical protein